LIKSPQECVICGLVVISLGMMIRHMRKHEVKPELLISDLGENGFVC